MLSGKLMCQEKRKVIRRSTITLRNFRIYKCMNNILPAILQMMRDPAASTIIGLLSVLVAPRSTDKSSHGTALKSPFKGKKKKAYFLAASIHLQDY